MQLRTIIRRLSTRTSAALLLLMAIVLGSWAWRYAQSPAQRHINSGLQKMESGQSMAAAIEWRQAVKLEPNNADAWVLLGDYYLTENNWSSALEAFKHVLQIKPDTSDLNARLAKCALELGNLEAARAYAEAELKKEPENIPALRVASSVSGTQHRNDDHLNYLQRLYKLQPQNPTVMLALALEYSERYNYAEAQPLLDKALAMEPDNIVTLDAHAKALYSEPTPENLQRAKADWKKVLTFEPDNLEAHRSLARVALLENQPREAIKHFQAVGRGRPYASAHFLELAKAYRMAGEPQKAQALQERFTALKQQNQAMQGLKDRIERSPKELANYLQLIALQIKSVEKDGDAYELYRYRYEQKQIGPPQYYMDQLLQIAPRDAQVLAMKQKLETTYGKYLQAGLKALQSNNMQIARDQLYHAVVLRPEDPRTESAVQKLPVDQQISITRIPTG